MPMLTPRASQRKHQPITGSVEIGMVQWPSERVRGADDRGLGRFLRVLAGQCCSGPNLQAARG